MEEDKHHNDNQDGGRAARDSGEDRGAAEPEAKRTPEQPVESSNEKPADPAEEVASLKDRLLRTMADLENTRRRAEREKEETTQFAIARFARDILSVSDNLRRALEAVTEEDRAGADDITRNLLSGVELTERELLSTLERHGIKKIDPKGEKFNAHFHQAMAEVPTGDQAPGTVVDVVQTGYSIGERLLRPAMVTVAKAASNPSPDSPGSKVDTTA